MATVVAPNSPAAFKAVRTAWRSRVTLCWPARAGPDCARNPPVGVLTNSDWSYRCQGSRYTSTVDDMLVGGLDDHIGAGAGEGALDHDHCVCVTRICPGELTRPELAPPGMAR